MNTRICLNSAASRACRQVSSVGLCMLLLTSVCQAQTLQTLQSPRTLAPQQSDASIWLAASDQTLDTLRGGFDLGTGLMVSFGISRAVYINGQLITSTTFRVGDLTSLTPQQAVALSQQISSQSQAQVVKNGPGNTMELSVGTAPLSTFIQNTLNNQNIRNQTIIDVTSNGMGMVKGLNLQATIDAAIADALGTR